MHKVTIEEVASLYSCLKVLIIWSLINAELNYKHKTVLNCFFWIINKAKIQKGISHRANILRRKSVVRLQAEACNN